MTGYIDVGIVTSLTSVGEVYFGDNSELLVIDYFLTPIGNILGPSPSVIFGNKIQKFFFDNFRQL